MYQIKLDSTYGYMAASNQLIFLGWKNRLAIYNSNGTKYDQTCLKSSNIYGDLCDLIWSADMQIFFILCSQSLFIHRRSGSQIEFVSNISLVNQDNQYVSIASFGQHIAILNKQSLELWKYSNETFLFVYSLPKATLVNNSLYEDIVCIRSKDENLAILIQNGQTHSWRINLCNLFPFRPIQMGLAFDDFEQPNLGLFISWKENTYLFMNWETKSLRIIGENGSNELIDSNAYNACLLGTQRKVVVNHMTHLKIYEF